jgi:carboxyl-terminal processing protease
LPPFFCLNAYFKGMKLKPIIFAVFLLFPFFCSAQKAVNGVDSARMVIDSALNYAKINSLYTSKVNWSALTDSVKKNSAGAHNIAEAMPAIKLMYKMLGDFHGGAYYRGKAYRWSSRRSNADYAKYPGLMTKFRKGKPAIETRMLEKGYGYLLIPNNNPTKDGEAYAIGRQIQDSLTKLNPATLKGIVIDLRLNTGGNMYPMILGVGNLFSKGKLGTFVYPKPNMNESWEIRDTTIFCKDFNGGSVKAFSKVNPKIKIAVLISPYTASSGEATTISFKGQKNARIIGDTTGGYTTANENFSYFGVDFLMATAVEADRNGTVYYENVPPEQEVIAGDNFEDFSKDEKMIAAMKWLKEK